MPSGKEEELWKFMVYYIFWFFHEGIFNINLFVVVAITHNNLTNRISLIIFCNFFFKKHHTPCQSCSNVYLMPQTMAPLTNICSMFWLYPKIWNEIPSSWDEAAISRLTWRLLNWDIRKSREYSYCERERAWMEIVWIYLCQKQK